MRSESREPDAGFIDNCSELHHTICPIEEEVDKSGSSFLIAFNQGKSWSWTICNQRADYLLSPTQQSETASDWKMEMFLLHKIIWNSSEFRCSASGRLLESGDGMVQLSSVNSEGVGESVKATDIAGLECTEIDFIPSKFAPDM